MWTVPVAGNHAGEPGHGSSFANSFTAQAWRWNLDYVVDVHGNSMVAHYTTETNKYGQNLDATVAEYVRGGWLSRIEYGHRQGTEHTVTAPARVMFTVAERCIPTSTETCTTLSASNAEAWPDVPQDLICSSSSTCDDVSPSFFTRKRLTRIRTEIRQGGSYQQVRRWDLSGKFPEPGDGTSASLWLKTITPHAGGEALPPIVFSGQRLSSRVDGVEDTPGHVAPPLIKFRLRGINNGQGADTIVGYAAANCTPTTLPPANSNGRRCFAVYWTPEGATTDPVIHWFHKRVVATVTEDDVALESTPSVVTRYTYYGAGWGYDDTVVTPQKYRTWSRWTGYQRVTTTVGDATQQTPLRTQTVYFRGLHGDRANESGGTKTVVVPDSEGGTTPDYRGLQGMPREYRVVNGPGGGDVEATITSYTKAATTATNPAGRTAEMWRASEVRGREPLASGGVRRTRTVTSYDTRGNPIQVDDAGDESTTADDNCTKTSWAHNATGWVTVPTRHQQRVGRCANWPGAPTTGQVLAEERTLYDGLGFGQVTDGLPTSSQVAATVGSSITYTTVGQTGYDSLGEPVSATDGLGAVTTAARTPAGQGLVTQIQVTSPDPDGTGPLTPHVQTATIDPRHGVVTALVAPGGETTQTSYDVWGRRTAVWEPGRDQATESASATYRYVVSATKPNTVTTKTLAWNGDYLTSVTLFDGLGRQAQTQDQEIDQYVNDNGAVIETVGRRLSETHYDTRGLLAEERGPIFTSGAPSTTFLVVAAGNVPRLTRYTHDGAGRATKQTLVAMGSTQWSATTSYQGELTHTTPPAGGTATTTIADAHGRQVGLRQYHGAGPSGASDQSSWTYDPAGRLVGMSDAAGNDWSWSYDQRGRIASQRDPDAGTSTFGYDNNDQVVTTTDARGLALAATYDALGRRTSLRDDTPAGTVRASWTYDTPMKGYPASSSRHLAGAQITTTITERDEAGRPTDAETVVPQIPGWIEAPLAGTYIDAWGYFPDGTLGSAARSARGNLPFETGSSQLRV